MMAAELRRPPYTRGTQDLVIRNYGPSVARNVKVTFDPPITDPAPERAAVSVVPFIKQRYAKPISVVTPGMELSNIWFDGRPKDGGFENVETTAAQFSVTIAYDGPDGRRHGKGPRYVDTFFLDTNLIRKHTYASSPTDPNNLILQVTNSLARIENSIARLAYAVESWETGERTQQ